MRSPAFIAAALSRIVCSLAYSLPAPWQPSHCIPSSIWNASSRSQASVSAATPWHPRHTGDFCGGSRRPLIREISADSGRASVAHACECFVVSHFEYCRPIAPLSWHCAQARAPM